MGNRPLLAPVTGGLRADSSPAVPATRRQDPHLALRSVAETAGHMTHPVHKKKLKYVKIVIMVKLMQL
jgi:hypothetical protein